ncbi:MAG: glutamate synthase subunit alpha, partial [Alphaproteobacteria bacterium]|nr:glutamate synthase subunit alpha [Alphaproteobacteria bacterium]
MAHGFPQPQGMYDPKHEHDSCGIGFVANISGEKTHKIVRQGLEILVNLTHRGAVGADPDMGDGAGILLQIPHDFFAAKCSEIGIELPAVGEYGVGVVFMPQDDDVRGACETLLETSIEAEGQTLLCWRDIPLNMDVLGPSVKVTVPVMRQIFVGRGETTPDQDAFERKLYVIRQRTAHGVAKLGDKATQFYVPSFSSRTVLYKGMLLAKDTGAFYADLGDERLVSALALVHQRFSTNTFPSWDLAQPFRMICHNGEINTVRGNINWMNARRQSLSSELLGDDLDKLWPLLPEGQSDSASFDNALELLVRGGYPMAQAVMLMIPEAWQGNDLMDPARRAMYEFNAALTEPWDGPAAIAFTDGRQIGATLDRNGLRPARYVVTDDGMVVLSSEAGVLPVDEDRIVQKWRLQPGKMLLIDTEQGRIIDDAELKADMAAAHPYQDLLDRTQVQVEDLPEAPAHKTSGTSSILGRQQAFGYTQEDIKFLMAPMAENGIEATGSMGNDTPIAAMSDKPKLLYNYFRQNFAQVTNPAIDPIRESLVMSLRSLVGPRPNLLGLTVDDTHPRLEVHQPILSNADLEKIRAIGSFADNPFGAANLDMTYPADLGADGMKPALDALCAAAQAAIEAGDNVLILSDRAMDHGRIPIPALLATGAVHHHLIRAGLRTSAGLVVETGEAREIHQFCVLAGYGAEAVNPYLAFETLSDMVATGILTEGLSEAKAHANYVKAANKGMLKVMSKMGISTYLSYCGAQIFDAVGLRSDFVEHYFYGTGTSIEGIGLDEIATEAVTRHTQAFGDIPIYRDALDTGGDYQYRERGEQHYWSPDSISKLQHAARGNALDDYRAYAKSINDQTERMMSPRGLFELKPAETPIPLDEVEPAKEIVKRFATGAMSYGSISREMHTSLAVAMNRIGGRSNTGEGGEESDRFTPEANGDSMRSSIKQVASGRFGVTTEYLVNSDMMQIKVAQG